MSAPTLYEDWEELANLKQGWDSYNGKPITRAALDALGRFYVVPDSSGGIHLSRSADGYDIEIEIGPEGRIEQVAVAVVAPKTEGAKTEVGV